MDDPDPLPIAWRTWVITKGVDPQVCCYYRSSRIKQYFKEHRACRFTLSRRTLPASKSLWRQQI
jgi:hypothetical protein